MGNLSSCTTGSDSGAQAASSSPPLAHTPPHVAKVLLIDGSMLKFRAPIKAIKLLLDYPNHLICPLDSLKPGLHSLSSLLPDEKLQLGRLYLLLPFKGNLQESCIKSKQVMQQKRVQNKEALDMQERDERARLLPGDKNGDVGRKQLQSRSLVVQEEHISKKKAGSRDIGKWQQKNHVNMIKSEVGFQDCAEGRKNGDVGPHYRRRSAMSLSSSYGKVSEKRRGTRREMGMRRYTAGKESNESVSNKKSCDSNVISPLCDTPELQRAYRSLLRRSSSWTPRLQPILERR